MKKSIAKFLLIACPFFFITNCTNEDKNDQNEEIETKTEGTPYSNYEVGWTMTVPEGWEIISKDQLDKNMKNGQDIIAESSTVNLNYDGLTHLINFKKDDYNQFMSTMEPFELEYAGEWEENNQMVYDFLYETYTFQGIEIDTSSRTTQLDGLLFQVFSITLYTPDGSILIYEDMYGRFINGYDFSVILTYNNTDDKVLLEHVLRQSKFTKRN